jgi:hypothetical protein
MRELLAITGTHLPAEAHDTFNQLSHRAQFINYWTKSVPPLPKIIGESGGKT